MLAAKSVQVARFKLILQFTVRLLLDKNFRISLPPNELFKEQGTEY